MRWMSRLDVRAMRREQVLDAMEPLVARQGWEQTTFAEICRAAGISNRVLTYHFTDKNDLLFAVFERMVRRVRENFEPLLPKGTPIAERLALMLNNAAVSHEKQQLSLLFLHLLAQAAVRPEIAARLHDFFREQRAHFADALARDAAEGRIRDDDPESAAALIQSLMLGVMLNRAVFGITIPPERTLAMMLAFLHADSSRTSNHEEECSDAPEHNPALLWRQERGDGGL